MDALRHTETNAADDSPGRAFGLDGNLYLPVLLSLLAALLLFTILVLLLRVPFLIAAGLAGGPVAVCLVWAFLLRQGKPAGYDRDLVESWLGRDHFTRVNQDQRRVGE